MTHGHDELDIDWATEIGQRGILVIRVTLAVLAALTIIGIVALWPDGSGRDRAIEAAEEVGLASERLEAVVDSVTDGRCSYSTEDDPQQCRTVVVVPSEGPDAGGLLDLAEFNLEQPGLAPDLSPGDAIILGFEPSTNFYFYADRDRRTSLTVLAVLFALVVVALGRLRGLLALVAMGLTLVVLIAFVAPSVLDGNDPVLVAVVAASAIAFVTLYLTHGTSPVTTVALLGTLAALALTLGVSAVFFTVADFTGLATEEGLTLPLLAEELNLSSLLLGGAIIGALGALDDVTVTQAATVGELRHRSPDLSRRQLTTSGIRVGREHIASTVNTLLLAYAGASMPLLLLFAVSNQSLGIVANSELIAVEIARTLCGSIGLVAAVPLTTLLAVALLTGPSRPTRGVPAVEAHDEAPGTDRPGADLQPPSDRPEPPAPQAPQAPAPRWEDFAPSDELDL